MTYQTTYGKGAIDDIARAPETPGTPLGATTPNQGQMVNFLLESVLELKTRLGEPTSPANGSALKRLSNLESGTWAPLDSPHFTGTVSGVTAAMVGLDNVNNTSDSNKPVSTAQQAALNSKANIASPTFTGTVSGITAGMVGAPSGSGTSTGTNTGDETQSSILSKLSIVSISGVNTGDETNASIKSKLGISTLSGSNTGDETATSIGTLISGATEKPTPIDEDELSIWDSVSGLLKKWSIANFKTWLQPLLYGWGFPRRICAVTTPWLYCPSSTVVAGGAGAAYITLGTALPAAINVAGKCYVPAVGSMSAGWYDFSSCTTTQVNLVAAVVTGGAFTATVGTYVTGPSYTLPANSLGPNGRIDTDLWIMHNNTAGQKHSNLLFDATSIWVNNLTTNTIDSIRFSTVNRSNTGKQLTGINGSGTSFGSVSSATTLSETSVDTTNSITVSMALKIATATDLIVLMGWSQTLTYGA